jgi:hypothetical protein
MAYFHRCAICSFVALLLPLLTGCGGGPKEKLVVVKGAVVEDGQAFTIAEDDYEEGGACLEVGFIPEKAEAKSFFTYAAPDGTFTMDGDMGDGIPLGKYKVSILRLGETDHESGCLWQGKFDQEKTPFTAEVTEAGGDVVIDLKKTS